MDQSHKETEEIRRTLEDQLARLLADLAAIEKSLDLKSRGDVGRPGFGKRVGDYTGEVVERVGKGGSARNQRQLIAETEAALRKLDEGTYGTCDGCAKPINPERLEALPAATLCLECKQKEETKHPRR